MKPFFVRTAVLTFSETLKNSRVLAFNFSSHTSPTNQTGSSVEICKLCIFGITKLISEAAIGYTVRLRLISFNDGAV